jgi:DNA-damage-inducible protein J
MALATITSRVDTEDKKAFDLFCSEAGLNPSTAINMFVKAVLRERRIPFEITVKSDPFYDRENQEYILKSVRELRDGKGAAHELIEDSNE